MIKLKLDQLNFTLIAYLRKVLQEQFYKGNEPFKVLLTKPVDIDFEVYIMRHYTEICKRLSAYLECGKSVYESTDPGDVIDTNRTTLEEDLRLLEVSSEAYDEKVDTGLKDLITGPMRQAITYRSEKKRILRFQIELANFMKELLMEASGLRLQAARMGDPAKLLTKYKTLYCQLLPLEEV